jgi:hypothetical protein
METVNRWDTTGACIAGESSAIAGLAKRRYELERLIEPYLSKKKTADTIRFRGETRYVKPFGADSTQQQVHSAIWGLQFVYRAESAIEAGDTQAASLWAYWVGRFHIELQFASKLNIDVGAALANIQRSRRINQAKGHSSKKDIPREKLKELLVKYRGEKAWRKLICRDLRAAGLSVSGRTISDRLKELGLKHAKQAPKRTN